jgi:hypothetical protein
LDGRTTCSRRRLALAAIVMSLCLSACGSGGAPTSPSGPAPGIFATGPESVTLVAGDRGWVFALAAANQSAAPQEVTDVTSWESSNPAVASVQGNVIRALSPGETTVRGSYRGLTGQTRVSVFATSAIRQFTIPTALICWPGETFSWDAQVTLDTGTLISPDAVTWRSLDDRMLSLAPVEQKFGTGNIGTSATVACRASGSTTIEASYAGRTAVSAVTVRAARDVIEIRGVSQSSTAGGITHGVTVFYLLDTASTAEIRFQSRDAANPQTVLAASSRTVSRGGGTVNMQNSVPAGRNVCEAVELLIPGSAPMRAAASCGF